MSWISERHEPNLGRSSGLERSGREAEFVIDALTDGGGDLVLAVLGVTSTSSQLDEAEATR